MKIKIDIEIFFLIVVALITNCIALIEKDFSITLILITMNILTVILVIANIFFILHKKKSKEA